MTLVPVIHAGGTAYLRSDTCEALGILPHQSLDAHLWQQACWDEYQRRKAVR